MQKLSQCSARVLLAVCRVGAWFVNVEAGKRRVVIVCVENTERINNDTLSCSRQSWDHSLRERSRGSDRGARTLRRELSTIHGKHLQKYQTKNTKTQQKNKNTNQRCAPPILSCHEDASTASSGKKPFLDKAQPETRQRGFGASLRVLLGLK